MKIAAIATLTVALCLLAANTRAQTVGIHSSEQDESFEKIPQVVAAPVLPRLVLVMDHDAQVQTIDHLHPTTTAGALRSISFPIGAELRDRAIVWFQSRYGSDFVAVEAPIRGKYGLALRSDSFTYALNARSHSTGTVTEWAFGGEVNFSVSVDIYDPSGKVVLHKIYHETHVSAACPKDRVVKHDALSGMLDETFVQIRENLICSYEAGLDDLFGAANTDLLAIASAANASATGAR